MSAVAQAALGVGMVVSGSDRSHDAGESPAVLDSLMRAGISLFPQDGSGVCGADAVVISTAIEEDNPDCLAAMASGIPVWHRSALLASLVEGQCCLAVAGTSGKSTVTGMAGCILEVAGLDPTVVNGAPVINWQSETRVGNVRLGRRDLWLIEMDESDRSLLNFHPQHAVITNMSVDHFGPEETQRLFEDFLGQVSGTCLGAFGVAPRADAVEVFSGGSRFRFNGVDFSLSLPGRHNIENAIHAALLCELMGVSLAASAAALLTFRGIHRRLERISAEGPVTVIDDYAHNPAKIGATLEALLPFSRRLITVWRPHGYGPLRSMLDLLAEVFERLKGGGHRLILLPVYDAGGTADRRINSDVLVSSLAERGVQVEWAADYAAVREAVRKLRPGDGDTVLVMGARDPGLPALARALASEVR